MVEYVRVLLTNDCFVVLFVLSNILRPGSLFWKISNQVSAASFVYFANYMCTSLEGQGPTS